MIKTLQQIYEVLTSTGREFSTPVQNEGSLEFENFGISAESIVEVQRNQRIIFYWVVTFVRNFLIALTVAPEFSKMIPYLIVNLVFTYATYYAYMENRYVISKRLVVFWFCTWLFIPFMEGEEINCIVIASCAPQEIIFNLLSKKNFYQIPYLIGGSIAIQILIFALKVPAIEHEGVRFALIMSGIIYLSHLLFFVWTQCTYIVTLERLISIKDALEQTSTQKDALCAGMIHDLRNPTNVVINCIDLAKDALEKQAPREEIEEVLTIAQNCSEHVNTLVTNFLDFAKLQARKIQLDPKPTNVL